MSFAEKPDVSMLETASGNKEKFPANAEPETLAAVERPNPWGKGHRSLYLMCALIYMCSTMNGNSPFIRCDSSPVLISSGYDGSLMGSINAIPEYQAYYNLGATGAASTGLVFSIFQIGQMAGALFTWICDWQGRRVPIFGGCLGVVISTIITAVAPNLPTFIGGRFLLSFCSTIATVAAPLYLVEIAPPFYRGTVAGMYNTLYYMGSILATCTIYGSNLHIPGNLKWRLPLWLQMVCPGLVCIGVWVVPESPRWLIGKGRVEEARQIITYYHANGDANHPICEVEMSEITKSLEAEGMTTFRTFFDLRVLFKSRARRYRLMLCMAMAWFGQFSGNNIASYYLPIMLKAVGITSVNTQLLLNIIYALTGWIAASSGARFHDIAGRRKMLMGSCIGMAICLAIVAATAADFQNNGNVESSKASIAFTFIFGVVFAFAFTSMQPIYPAEVLSNDQRAKGMAVFQITAGCAGFVNTFAAPIALNNITYWFYIFFVFWDVFEALFIYFFFVETKGRTLEELDAVFEAKSPRKASTALILARYTV
ncbi:hypothetical protein ONS95_004622 [Cadophora gregata]|uniref:uncharacterized protein n=1 Tax=Cadophora gregata TaxID=51156 RepID=UPI0026DBBAA0|nr:uncharacterized protein ONS95_004622 [Cadophora gregata]KAK0105008.1 hypothetical protein ONS96_004416 [Cadophora gregata f. sp. sojae]KAK0106120.1 hypothetical protein ONS95_004622 [Cadophora gregata]